MTRYGFGDSDAQQLSTQFVNAAATAQKHVRWVACTESSCGAGGRDGCVRRECRRDVDITRSTEAGRERVAWMPQRSFNIVPSRGRRPRRICTRDSPHRANGAGNKDGISGPASGQAVN